ncbi:PLP-dependent aminotransferase family protein [Roseibium denhamense]
MTAAIKREELATGDKLPPHRDLAHMLGLSVQTVSRAYDLLIQRGMASGHVGRGTYVSAKRLETQPPYIQAAQGDQLIDFSNLKPVGGQIHVDRMRATLSALSQDMTPSALFSFRPANALRPYLAPAISWLETCGLSCSQEQIVMTNGSSSAMTTALLTVAGGGLVVSDQTCHHPLLRQSQYLGFRLMGLNTDQEGITPDGLEAACRKTQVKALFVLPNGLNPMALTMGLERRSQLVEIARRYDIAIIENDAWGPVQEHRLPPIASLAPERTAYFTSFTKCLLPGLRHGYLVMPDTQAQAAANRHLATDWTATPLMADIAARWIEDGTAAELLSWQQKTLDRRNQLVREILSPIPFNSSSNGLHIWLPLPGEWTEDAFIETARQKGIVVAPGSAFALPEAQTKPGIRVCLGTADEDHLVFGLEQLALIWHSRPEPGFPVF